MTKRGRKITVFLIDGDPNGRIMCELSNWSGKAYRIFLAVGVYNLFSV